MNQAQRLDATFAALADPTRRAILARLASGEASVNELAGPFAISQPAISKHLLVLERAGLISTAREGQRRPRRLEAERLAEAARWLEQYREFWEARFQSLDALLAEMQAPRPTSRPQPLPGKPAPQQPGRRTPHQQGLQAPHQPTLRFAHPTHERAPQQPNEHAPQHPKEHAPQQPSARPTHQPNPRAPHPPRAGATPKKRK